MQETNQNRLELAVTDKGSRAVNIGQNLLIGLAYTGADIVESKVFRTINDFVSEKRTKALEAQLEHAVASKKAHDYLNPTNNTQQREMQKAADALQIQIVRDALRKHEAIRTGVDFAEETLSDKALTKIGQSLLDKGMNYVDGPTHDLDSRVYIEKQKHQRESHTYVNAFAENLSEYANMVMQVVFGDRWIGFLDKEGNPKKFMGIMLAERSANFVNPGNTEAALRILSNIPLLENVVRPVKKFMDRAFETPLAGWVNTAVRSFVLGFHVRNSQMKAVHKVEAALAA